MSNSRSQHRRQQQDSGDPSGEWDLSAAAGPSPIDPLIPNDLEEPAERELAVLVISATLLALGCLLVWIVAMAVGSNSSESPAWLPIVGGVLLTLPLLEIWFLKAPRAAAHTLLAAGLVTMMLSSLLDHGLLSAQAQLIPCIPLLALVMLGRRAAVLWMVLTIPVLASLYVVSTTVPEHTHTNLTASAALLNSLFQLALYSGLVLVALTRRDRALALATRARAAAEQAADARQKTLAVTSHELRTPLNGILASLELLRPQLDAPESIELHSLAVRSGETLRTLVEDILVHSRLSAGKLQPEQVPFHLRPLLHDLQRLFRPEADRKNISLRIVAEPDIPAMWRGDPRRLSQVLTNLLGNALKFTQEGSVELRARSTPEGLEFAVTDSGPGISPELAHQLFQPFVQADASTSRRHGGSGLGLAIAQQLVQAMEGTLEVRSEPGQGATFIVFLPLRSDAVMGELDDEPTNARIELRPNASRVLIVEDNPVNRRVLELMLTELGSEVTTAPGGAEGARVAVASQWDLILMDCRMPEVDGFEATRRIREAGVIVPVVAVTASATPAERAECIACGMDGVLEKPVTQEAVRGLLVRWVGLGHKPGTANP